MQGEDSPLNVVEPGVSLVEKLLGPRLRNAVVRFDTFVYAGGVIG